MENRNIGCWPCCDNNVFMQSFPKNKGGMSLTVRERVILQLAGKGLSAYKIAHKINTAPPSVIRSLKDAHKNLDEAKRSLEWAEKIELLKP